MSFTLPTLSLLSEHSDQQPASAYPCFGYNPLPEWADFFFFLKSGAYLLTASNGLESPLLCWFHTQPSSKRQTQGKAEGKHRPFLHDRLLTPNSQGHQNASETQPLKGMRAVLPLDMKPTKLLYVYKWKSALLLDFHSSLYSFALAK